MNKTRSQQCAIEPPPTRPASPGPARPPPSGSCIPHCEICYIWPEFQVSFPVLNPQTKKTCTPSTLDHDLSNIIISIIIGHHQLGAVLLSHTHKHHDTSSSHSSVLPARASTIEGRSHGFQNRRAQPWALFFVTWCKYPRRATG